MSDCPRFRAARTRLYWKVEQRVDDCPYCSHGTQWRTLLYTYQLLPLQVQEELAINLASCLNAQDQEDK